MISPLDGPSIDNLLDHFLTHKVDGLADPLDPGAFPSLGFDGEKRGSYFMEVEQGDRKVTVWRIINAFGAPETYTVQVYQKHNYNGVTSWGTNSKARMHAESLVQVQGMIHHFLTEGFTSGGNDE